MSLVTSSLVNESERRDLSNCILLGKLVEDNDENIPPLGLTRNGVTYRQDDKVVIYLQSLSSEPKLLRQVGKDPKAVFIQFDNRSQSFFRSIKYPDGDVSGKVEFLRNYLQDKLILFKPQLTHRSDGIQTFHHNFEFVWVGDKIESSTYHAVPYVERNLSSNRFEKFLLETDKRTPFSMQDYPNLMETPDFIHCDKQLYHVTDPDALGTNPMNRKLYYCKNPEKILRIDLPDNWQDEAKAVHRDISFITDKYRNEVLQLFADRGRPLTEERIVVQPPTQSIESSSSQGSISASQPQEEMESSQAVETEIIFINRLKRMAQSETLYYEDHDLYNFHTALKTNFVTILGGMSGTGKTKLATLYAQALGLKINDDYIVIPVSPSFTEPADILGYLNHQLGIYVESDTGLVSFLKQASEYEDKLHMVIFDEMNLGQVEHYFSPFISVLEMDENDRYLTLFSENAVCRDKSLKPKIKIGKNVIFVGTVNFDETTKDFSKRLLDRANVIQLEKMDLTRAATIPHVDKETEQRSPIKTTIYRKKWTQESNGLQDLDPEERDFLDELHMLISNVDAQSGVSFRVVKAISSYLKNIPKDEHGNALLTRYRGLDYQVKQRLLTKVRGHREQLENLIGTYDFARNEYLPGDLGAIFDDEQLWKYSREYLVQKAKELTRNGYTL